MCRPQTLVCGSGWATDQNYAERREGAAGAWHYHRADCQSAGVTLSVVRRAYRQVVKDPAGWDVSKPTGGPPRRRRFAPSAQEPSGAHRRRIGRRTRPEAAGEVATSSKPASDQPKAGRGGRCNQRKRLLTKRRWSPQTRQKGRRPLHPIIGAPRKKIGARGKKNAQRFASPRSPRAQNVCRALVFTSSCRDGGLRKAF